MRTNVLSGLIFFALALSILTPAFAQEAPPPRKMPRVAVHRESIQDRRPAVPATREVQGQAVILDGENLKIGDLDLRLFGVVPPQLSASFGPQARAALDELTAAQNTTCLIRDRDREERFLATCRNAANTDLALELLKRGLAVTARGSIASTELAASYVAAEQAAAAQKMGLWSMAIPAAAAPSAAAPVSEAPKVEKAEPAATAPVAALPHSKTTEEKPAAVAAKPEPGPTNVMPETALPLTPASALPPLVSAVVYAQPSEPFLARYQLLVTGLIMLVTALCILGVITIQRLRDKREEMRAIAAALRGELMAAHAICRARLRASMDIEDKDITWPRLRSTLYQAYVGRVGWLGAELARRIASIYGQASDYAAYYADDDQSRVITLPKRQALQNLVHHIDDVLPRLAIIEHTGNPSSIGVRPPRPAAVVVPLASQSGLSPMALASPNTLSVAREKPVIVKTARASSETVMRPASTFLPSRIWSAVQRLARPLGKKNSVNVRDPIAEYTALIEEEMKRFAFLEEGGEPGERLATETGAAAWSQKIHETF